MPGLEADTSSYNQPLPVSPLEIAKNIGGLQQQKLQIDQTKLDQANQGLQYMTRAMGALGPDAPKEAYIKAAADAVKMGLVPENQLHVFEAKAAAAPDSKSFFNEFMTAAASHQEQINYHLGQPANNATGQTITPTVRSVKPGFGERPIGLPVQQQNPPSTPSFDENGQPRLLGPQAPQVAPGAVSGPMPLPVERPVPRVSGPTGPTIRTDADRSASFAERTDAAFPKPTGPAAGPSPLFTEGKEAYAKSQLMASNRAQSIKPAIQALKLMPGLATGPGTEQFNNLVAAAKAWGIVDTKAENDPTVLRQELNKKLAQYVGGSPIAQRSDAAQTLAEAGSPNPKVQLTQALQNLTRDAIALDRVQILLPNAFKGQDFQNFIKHAGNFPQSIDEKALTLDLMDDKERDKLVGKMKSDYKNGDGSVKRKAVKFFETLQQAKDAKLYDTGD